MTLMKLFESARLRSVPIVVIRTADQAAMTATIADYLAGSNATWPIVQWDAVRGLTGVGKETGPGQKALAAAQVEAAETVGFTEAMIAIARLPRASVVLAHNAHRQLASSEPASTAPAVQAVANLRDRFKQDFRMLVLMGPSFTVPAELEHDVVVLDQPLPDEGELRTIVTEIGASAKAASKAFAEPKGDVLAKAIDAVSGLSSFAAEQVLSLSLTETTIDLDALWERKRAVIEQTRGLSVYRGTETLDDLRGLDSIKARLRQHISARTPIGVVVWIDEGADVFQNVEHDTSGVKTDQQRALLVEMEQNGWRGVINVGVPGAGKSAIARGFANEAATLNIVLDFGDMEGPHVGESEQMLRSAMKVIKAIGRGHAFFILTCNSLKGIRPQFMRRFKRGVFFFDLPTPDERAAIWALYERKFALKKQPRPDDDGWTGAEIRECCESAWDTGVSLLDAARFIVPVSRSRATEIEEMRKEAHGRFLDASAPGAYQYRSAPMAKQVRAIALAKGSEALH